MFMLHRGAKLVAMFGRPQMEATFRGEMI